MCRDTQTHTHTLTVVVRIRKKCMTKDGDFRFAVYYSLSACCALLYTLYAVRLFVCIIVLVVLADTTTTPADTDEIGYNTTSHSVFALQSSEVHFIVRLYRTLSPVSNRKFVNRNAATTTTNRKQNTEFGNSVSEYMVDMVL